MVNRCAFVAFVVSASALLLPGAGTQAPAGAWQDGILPHSHCEEAARPTWQSLGEQVFFDGKIATLKTTSGQAPLRGSQ
jgi:hypothetical protein